MHNIAAKCTPNAAKQQNNEAYVPVLRDCAPLL